MNNEIDVEHSSPKKLRSLIQTIGIVITLLASLATLASLWFQVRQSKLRIDAVTQYVQNLTNLPKVPQLTASFKFAERDVADLWQLKLVLSNTGNKTLIGEGPQKNIVKDALVFSVSDGFELLDIQTDTTTFPNEIKKLDSTSFTCRFLQWRPNESSALILYLERKDIAKKMPHIEMGERFILDGDVYFIDAIAGAHQPKPVLDYTPGLVANTLRVFSCIVVGLLALLFIVILFVSMREVVQFSSWKKKHFEHFSEFVRREFPDEADLILEKPSSAKSHVWDKYTGEKPTVKNIIFEGDKQKRTAFVFSIFMILLILALLGAIFGLIII